MTARSINTEGDRDGMTVIERQPSYCYAHCDACRDCLTGQTGHCHYDRENKRGVIQ